MVDKPVVGANPRNPQDPNLEGTQNSILEYQYSIIKTFLKYFCSFWFKGLKLCPKTHPYAYRNGTACCGGPGYQYPGNEDFEGFFGNLIELEWSTLTCDGGSSISCPGNGRGCEDGK